MLHAKLQDYRTSGSGEDFYHTVQPARSFERYLNSQIIFFNPLHVGLACVLHDVCKSFSRYSRVLT